MIRTFGSMSVLDKTIATISGSFKRHILIGSEGIHLDQ